MGATLLGYVVFPDITKTIDMMEKLAVEIDPQYKPGELKAEAGKMLNDPSLSNIDQTKPLMVAVYYETGSSGMAQKGMQNVSYAYFIPAKDKAAGKKVFDGKNIPGAVIRDVLVVSDKKTSLDRALKDIDLYKRNAAEKPQSDMRLLVKVDGIMSVFNSEIEMFVSMMQNPLFQQPDNSEQGQQKESLVALGKIFIYGILDLAQQSKDYQLDVSISEKALQISSEHSAKPGSDLYDFFNGIPPEKNRCLALLPAKGDLTYAGYFDTRRLNILIGIIIKNAINRDPYLKDKINMTLINQYRSFISYYLGEFALVYGFDNNLHFKMDLAASTNRSPESHLAMNEKFINWYMKALKSLSPGAETFTEYTLQKNVRKSGGFDVHRYVMKMNYTGMGEEEKASMKKMFGEAFTSEYAVANGFVVVSTNPESLDRMIENTVTGGGGIGLQSMTTFGAGMDSYYDFDIAGFIRKIAMMSGSVEGKQKDPVMEKILDKLDKLPPEERNLVSSSKYSKGTSYNRYQVSVQMIRDMAKFFNEQKAASLKSNQPDYKDQGENYKQ